MSELYCKGCGTDMSSFSGGCPICYGISADSGIPVEKGNNIKGYVCLNCGKISKKPVAFSNPEPKGKCFMKGGEYEGYGEHYDGCRGGIEERGEKI